jgi:serine/threonine protein kinase
VTVQFPPPRIPEVPGLTDLAVLAHGGYATVYRARQISVGRPVAVKVEDRALLDEDDQRRFLREAYAAGEMSGHPNVVDLFDVGVTADGHPYLIMELCAGTYADRLARGPLAPAEVRTVGVKIADALANAHTRGVLHRDVKPANILCSRFGEPTLTDFGLAVLTESRESVSMEVLTPAFAPPELFRHGTEPSAAADVYGLCASLYAMLHGYPPRWHDDSVPSLAAMIELFDQPIPDVPGCGEPLLDALRSGMDNVAAKRPSAARVRDALLAIPTDELGVVTTSVFALPRRNGSADSPTVNWSADTATA